MKRLAIVALTILALAPNAEARGRSGGGGGCCNFVRGYVRSNGTYVHSYFRASPGAGRLSDRTRESSTFPAAVQGTGSRTSANWSNDDAVGAPMEEVREVVAGPHPGCAGHKMYGTGYGVCVEGGQLEE